MIFASDVAVIRTLERQVADPAAVLSMQIDRDRFVDLLLACGDEEVPSLPPAHVIDGAPELASATV